MDSRGMDEIYRTIPLEEIPWNSEAPPDVLVELVESGGVQPCCAIDLGCGAGNYAIYLASHGFDVTGVDISPSAIEIARKNAERKEIKCDFTVADVLGDMKEIPGKYDFAFGWELLHHIFPKHRSTYVKNVYSILNPGGKYLSVCFSEQNKQFGGAGKVRETPLGTVLYFSSEEELRGLFSPYFDVLELKTIQIKGRHGPHDVVYGFMEKKM